MNSVVKNDNEKIYRAKMWGIRHGFYGMPGGWIYHKDIIPTKTDRHGPFGSSSKPICHGWAILCNQLKEGYYGQ